MEMGDGCQEKIGKGEKAGSNGGPDGSGPPFRGSIAAGIRVTGISIHLPLSLRGEAVIAVRRVFQSLE